MTTDCLARRQVEFKELYRLLRPGKRVRLRAPLREGARGPIEPLPKNAIELRRDVRERRAPSQALREATVAEVRRPAIRSSRQIRVHSRSKSRHLGTYLSDPPPLAPQRSLPIAPAQLRHALMTGAGKVITLFKQLDEDRDGSVSKAEFRRALPLLGYDGSNTDAIDSVFDELDLDGSGEIRYDELKALLTVDRLADRGMELAAVLQDGALGEITATAKNRHSLRHGDVRERRGEGRQASIDALREALTQSAGRVSQLFRSLDGDHDGGVTREEFASGLRQLGYAIDEPELIGDLFNELDSSADGSIAYAELEHLLRPRAEIAESLRAGAKGEIGTHRTQRNRHELRPGGINLLELKAEEEHKAEEVEEAEAAEAKVARKAVAAAEAEAARAANEAQALRREEEARAAAAAGEGHAGGRVLVACEVEAHAYARLRFEWQELGTALMQTTDGGEIWRGVAIELTISTRAPIACLDLVML